MIRLANAPCSWGINELAGDRRFTWEQVLDGIASSGYRGTELGPYGFLPTDPAVLREALEARELTLLAGFVQISDSVDQVAALLAAVGAPFLVLSDDNTALQAEAGRRTGVFLSSFDEYAARIEALARRVTETYGLEVVFHHHGGGYVETPEEVNALLERTTVGLCLDTGHMHFGGGDAVECWLSWSSRIRYLHLKDYRPVEGSYLEAVARGTFCELGKGEVDFPRLFMNMSDYDGWAVVEQDVLDPDPAYPLAAARANREYLRGQGL